MTKEPKPYNGEKKASSTNGAGKIGKPYAKEQNKDLNIRSETVN